MPEPTHYPFGRYKLLRRIASGGMAEIYVAQLLGVQGFQKEIVIKKILPQWTMGSNASSFINMLIDEAKIAVQLNHPNITQVYELGCETEQYYIAMEYVAGVDLKKVFQTCLKTKIALPSALAVFVISEILEGLQFAHLRKDSSGKSLEIIHRDISPQNILLSWDGFVKIADFGIAKAAFKSHQTETGALKGKFAYMSPEQANQESLDARSDLYAVGILLYELLSGERLFYRGNDVDTWDRVRRGEINFSENSEKIITKDLRLILIKALAKKPEDRFQSAREFQEALNQSSGEMWHVSSREKLSLFLKTIFSEEFRGYEDVAATQTAQIIVKDSQDLTKTLPSWKNDRKVLGFGLSILLGIMLVYFNQYFYPRSELSSVSQKVEVSKEETPKELLVPPVLKPSVKVVDPIKVVDGSAKKKVEEPVKAESGEKGILNIQVMPWGTVSIDGGAFREAPIAKWTLSSGRHHLKVYYEPTDESLQQMITIPAGRSLICVAKFQGGKKITCAE